MYLKECFLCLFINFFLINSIYANSYTVHCPAEIKVNQQLVASYQGWRIVNTQDQPQSNASLVVISMYVDAPEKLGLLMSDGNAKEAVWRFKKTDQVYAVCEYQNTNIQLTQQLPAQTTSCSLSFKKDISSERGPLPLKLTCIKES